MMSKCCVICLILFWEVCQKADAQIWSKNDSIRLANILSGKDTFRINPEFQRAIKNGTFINTEPVGKMRMSHSSLPITKDFSEYIKLDRKALSNAEHSTIKNAPDFKALTPQAAMHVQSERGTSEELRINPKAYAIPLSIIREAKSRSSLATFDANHLLSYMLSSSYRQKLKNSKRMTHLLYQRLPTPEILRKQKAFRKAHPELVMEKDSVK
ncbi:MAG: hypothetical protein L6V92_10810 [Phocaeicola vulgatus]|nr:MAG: hypothetical protein L6V92_10810 [Phocaeicola vulgatus]